MEAGLRVPLPWISRRLGRPRHLVVRAPRAGEFFEGMPDVFPQTECFSTFDSDRQRLNVLEVERWIDRVLSACVLEPRPFPVALGPDRAHVVHFLFERWGWVQRADGTVVGLPGPNFREILRWMARQCGTPPSQLMKQPINEFIFDYHVLYGDHARTLLQRRQQREGGMTEERPDVAVGAEGEDA